MNNIASGWLTSTYQLPSARWPTIACPLGSVPTGGGPAAGCRSVKRTVTRAPGTGLPAWFLTSTAIAAGPSHGLAV
ncbi:MAG TPA: hypothetical protein VN811_04060 [Thermoanaerobaculia bacterium]|nr:hypothetical protein [Thermoanaerobaculia bacterium]HXT50189.1 hypothetical protein [Thermoanaerobaculia bacterium]